jgi:hypothetical protein
LGSITEQRVDYPTEKSALPIVPAVSETFGSCSQSTNGIGRTFYFVREGEGKVDFDHHQQLKRGRWGQGTEYTDMSVLPANCIVDMNMFVYLPRFDQTMPAGNQPEYYYRRTRPHQKRCSHP